MANYAGIVWLNVLSLVFIPVYIRHLGATQWGVVATCMSLQIFFIFLDSGLSQVMPRRIALSASDPKRYRVHFKTFQRLYLILALGGLAGGQLLIGPALHGWFKVDDQNRAELGLCLRIVVVQLFFQLMNGAHNGFWNGMQRQATTNWRQCLFGTLKHVSAVAAVLLVQPSATTYVMVFAVIAALEFACNRCLVERSLGPGDGGAGFSRAEFVMLVRESGVVTAGALLGAVVAQMDRMLLSGTVATRDFGVYVVLLNISAALLQLQAPIVRALFPRIAREIHAAGRSDALHWLLLGTVCVCVIPSLIGALNTGLIMSLWIGDQYFVFHGARTLSLLMTAVAINAIYGVIYATVIASGHGKVVLAINAIAATAVFAAYMLCRKQGIEAGGWMAISNACTQLTVGAGWMVFRAVRHRDPPPAPH